jgi:hypothetical protein
VKKLNERFSNSPVHAAVLWPEAPLVCYPLEVWTLDANRLSFGDVQYLVFGSFGIYSVGLLEKEHFFPTD